MTLTRSLSVMVATLLCMLALSVVAKADTIVFTATLTSSQEVPSNGSMATGTATLILNDVTGQAIISVSFTGLSSGFRDGHIHGPAAPGVNAGVIQGFGTQFTAGVTSGTLTNYTFPVALTAQQIADLKNGLVYVNIHSINFPGGEIRGQLTAVPEPGTLLLLGAGLLSVAGALKRRRQRDA